MIALNAPKIDGDQALEFEIGLFAAEMPEQHIFGRDRRIGLEFETPMAVLVLTGEQRLRRARDMTLQRLRATADLENDRGRYSLRKAHDAASWRIRARADND